MNKLRAFQSFVYSSTYNIFAIVETWLSHFIFDKEVFLVQQIGEKNVLLMIQA